MGDLHRLRGHDHLGGVSEAQLRGQERECRADALPAGLEKVPGRDVREVVGERHLLQEPVFDLLQAVLERDRELLLVGGGEEGLPQPECRLELVTTMDLLGILRPRHDALAPASEAFTRGLRSGLCPRCRATTPAVRLR